jgi:hypothetical protein
VTNELLRFSLALPRLKRTNVALVNRLLSLAGILATLLLCGCCGFNRAWDKAGQTPASADSIEGRWEGRWLSDINGHTGRLRCLLTRSGDTNYTARFRATYWKIFRYSYQVDLQFEQRDGLWHLRGDENLGWLAGGVYQYSGSVSPTNFQSTYRSKYDHGVFEMTRP